MPLWLGEACSSDSSVFSENGSAARMSSGSSSVAYTEGPGADSASPTVFTAMVLIEHAVEAMAAPVVSATRRTRTERDAGSANVLPEYDETGRQGDSGPAPAP